MARRRKINPSTNGRHDPSQPIIGGIDAISLNRLLQQNRSLAANATSRSVQELRAKFDLDPRRSIDDECGYPAIDASISLSTYKQLYDREEIPARVVELMPKESWQVTPEVYEDENPDVSTPFEEAWADLPRQLRGGQSWFVDDEGEGSIVWTELRKADILSRIGHFGIILLGIADGKNLADPVDGVVEPATGGDGDSPLSSDDEAKLKNPKPTPKVKLNPKPPQLNAEGNIDGEWRAWVTENEVAPPLTTNEKQQVEAWAQDREALFTFNQRLQSALPTAQACLTVNQAVKVWNRISDSSGQDPFRASGGANGSPSGMQPPASGETADQFSGASGGVAEGKYWQPSPLAGTDQQYFGVQFGPSQLPSSKPSSKKVELTFLRSFDESLVQIVRYEWNVNNPRFGMPVMYRVTLNDPREQHSGIGLPLATVFVHWSRVIHIADHHDNVNSSAIFAPPVMRAVLNRLLDLRKLHGAFPEGYWKSCFTKLSFETHPQLGGDVIVDDEGLRDMMEDSQNSQQGFYRTTGMHINPIAPAVVDPTPFHTVLVQAICIKLGCPQRVFMGTERGELASSQDDGSWNDRLRERQHKYITPLVIAPFIDRLIMIGVLPEPKQGFTKPPPMKPSPPVTSPPRGIGAKPGGAKPGSPKPGIGGGGAFGASPPSAGAPAPSLVKGAPNPNPGNPNEDAQKPPPKAPSMQSSRPPSLQGNADPRTAFDHAGPTDDGDDPTRDPSRLGQAAGAPDAGSDDANPSGGLDGGLGGADDSGDDPTGAGGEASGALGKDGLPPDPSLKPSTPGWKVYWPDLDSPTEMDQSAICAANTTALAAYVAGNCESAVPLEHYLSSEKFMNMDDDQVDMINFQATQSAIVEEQKTAKLIDEGGFEPLPPEGYHDPENPIPIALGPGQSLHDPQSGQTKGKSPFAPPAPPPVAAPNLAQTPDTSGGGAPPNGPPGKGPPKPGQKATANQLLQNVADREALAMYERAFEEMLDGN